MSDIELVLFNARLYNPPGNYVHDESKKIQKYMTKTDKRLHKIVQKYGTEADKVFFYSSKTKTCQGCPTSFVI